MMTIRYVHEKRGLRALDNGRRGTRLRSYSQLGLFPEYGLHIGRQIGMNLELPWPGELHASAQHSLWCELHVWKSLTGDRPVAAMSGIYPDNAGPEEVLGRTRSAPTVSASVSSK